jgi:hypothetical protein
MPVTSSIYSGIYAIEYWVSRIYAKQAPRLHLPRQIPRDTLKATSLRLCTMLLSATANTLRAE